MYILFTIDETAAQPKAFFFMFRYYAEYAAGELRFAIRASKFVQSQEMHILEGLECACLEYDTSPVGIRDISILKRNFSPLTN